MSNFGPIAMSHFKRPHNVGAMPDADAVGQEGNPGRGNYMVIYLKISDGRIERTTFQTYGCPGAICCGSVITDLARGRTIDGAAAIEPVHVITALGGLPLGKRHCAKLAVGALRRAIGRVGR